MRNPVKAAAFALTLLGLVSSFPAYAMGDCDDLNFSLHPTIPDVVQCAHQLSDRLSAIEAENNLLKTYVCSFALEDWIRDKSSLGASIFVEDCPKPMLKKTMRKR